MIILNISAYNMIDKVNIPLLCLNSIDDGLTSNKTIPYDHIRLNENIFLLKELIIVILVIKNLPNLNNGI